MPIPTNLTLKKYGLTALEYTEMFERQGGVCAICKRPPKKLPLNIDHEHQLQEKKQSPESRKEKIRGLTCHRCNRALGLLGNKPDDLRRAAINLSIYIENYIKG